MKKIRKLMPALSMPVILCFAMAGAMLPAAASAESGTESLSVGETANTGSENVTITANEVPEAEVIASQMKEYYLNETEPQWNTYGISNASATALPEADESYKLLKLPLYRQSHNFTCGVACVASVLRYAGYDFDTREDRLLWALAATPENGTCYVNITEYLDAVRIEGFPDMPVFATETVCEDYSSNEYDLTLTDRLLLQLRAALDEDSPVICVIQAWKDDGDYQTKTEDDGHYVVLVGYKKDTESDAYIYYFMDPSTSGSYTYLTEEEFVLRWHDNLEGESKRIGIIVSYLRANQGVPIDVAYHLD